MTIHAFCEGFGWLRFNERRNARGNYDYKFFSTFGLELQNPVARDLVRFGIGVFLTDRAFRHEKFLGRRTRQLKVVIPVEEPDRWGALVPHIVRLADFVSQDRWAFQFKPLKHRRKKAPLAPTPENAAVHLFSDGLDSLCGAAAALQRAENPILVTHIPPGRDHVAKKWKALRNALKLPEHPIYHVAVRMAANDKDERGRRRLFPERTRRSRPLFYLCLAGAVALELRVPSVNLNENGVLAVNLPWSQERTGWDITRHAHPETLRRFEQVLRCLWPDGTDEPTVRNPLFEFTKAEELAFLRNNSGVACETISCEFARQTMATVKGLLRRRRQAFRDIKECGLCGPCLVRRSAMAYAGAEEHERHYLCDARQALKGGSSCSHFRYLLPGVQALHSFCTRISSMDASGFVNSFPYEMSLLPDRACDAGKTARLVYNLHRRFARQVLQYLA